MDKMYYFGGENTNILRSLFLSAAIIGGEEQQLGETKVFMVPLERLHDNIEELLKMSGEKHNINERQIPVISNVLPHSDIKKKLEEENLIRTIEYKGEKYFVLSEKIVDNYDAGHAGHWV